MEGVEKSKREQIRETVQLVGTHPWFFAPTLTHAHTHTHTHTHDALPRMR